MTIEEVENTKDIDMQKKELEKKIEVFKKNEETVYDLLALYEHLTSTKKPLKDSFLLCLLVDKLIGKILMWSLSHLKKMVPFKFLKIYVMSI